MASMKSFIHFAPVFFASMDTTTAISALVTKVSSPTNPPNIIGTISNLDQPMTPALKGDRSMNLYMNHVTEDMIKEERAQVLEATQEDIRELAGIVEAMMKAEQFCVIGSEDKIEEAKDMFDTVTGF